MADPSRAPRFQIGAILLILAFTWSLAAPHCAEARVRAETGFAAAHPAGCCDQAPAGSSHDHGACVCPCFQLPAVSPRCPLCPPDEAAVLTPARDFHPDSVAWQAPDPVPIRL